MAKRLTPIRTDPDREVNPSEERAETAWENKKTIVIGCGNVLLGDDGFGPYVIKELSRHELPPNVGLVDAGTGIRKILFNMALGGGKPEKMIIVDAIDLSGKRSGEVFEISVKKLPPQKKEDFAVHHLPTTNMLSELKHQRGVDLKIIAAQVEELPSEMRCGISKPVRNAVKKTARMIIKEISRTD